MMCGNRRALFRVLPVLFAATSCGAGATEFFNNLSASNGGSEIASASTYEATAFTTDSATYTQLSATLLLDQSAAGAAELDLYSSIGLEPGTFIKAFNSPASYSSSLTGTTFTASNVSLAANTTYWLVLKGAATGSFDWGWTNDFSVLHDWGQSTDAGATWFTSDSFPFQFSVTGSVPEPTVLSVAAIGVVGLSLRRRRRHPASI
jgi:hypothetical protein